MDEDDRILAVTAAEMEGGGVVWTIRDISDRARLERLKTEFVATASHELRSPLTSIKGFVELLSRSEGLDEKQREFLDVILLSTNRLVDLVNDLLDVARIEAGQFEIHRRPTDVVEAVREVATLIEPRIADKAQELDMQLPRVLPPALADPARLRQIATNLITNAHLYTPPRGRIRVRLEAEEHAIVLRVSDNGRGMTPEEQEHIFDRFYRGADGRGAPGTGLGLSVVKSLVDLHGGSITVESKPDQGSQFTVKIPRQPLAEGGPLPREALRGRKVLVVDDEPEIAELITVHLEPYEVETTVAHSGAEALEHLRRERFDAMTLDILMPGMSGFDVLDEVRADPELSRTSVVFVSVYSGRSALAGEWTVAKPIDAEQLTDALGSAVLAGRTRVLVVGRESVRSRLEPSLDRLGLDHDWATTGASAARMCEEDRYEVALVDAGMRSPQTVLQRARPARPAPAKGRARVHDRPRARRHSRHPRRRPRAHRGGRDRRAAGPQPHPRGISSFRLCPALKPARPRNSVRRWSASARHSLRTRRRRPTRRISSSATRPTSARRSRRSAREPRSCATRTSRPSAR